MRRITIIATSIISVLVIGYGGWLSAADSGDAGSGGGDETTQTGKPGEAPKEPSADQTGKPGETK